MNTARKVAGTHQGSLNRWREFLRLARMDLVDGLRRYALWHTMAVQDLRRSYRRSVLGPLWITLSLVIFVTALSLLYGHLMGIPIERYAPHVALGLIAWQFIQGVVIRSCHVFIANRNWIINERMPLSLFVFRMVWEHLITMGHDALVYLGIAVIFGIYAGVTGLLIVPALILLIANAVWVGLVLGTLCARFRDIPQIIQNLMRVAFFLTPVIWMADQLGDRSYLALFNPFTYFVELVREPLMGKVPSAPTWGLALAVTLAGWMSAWLIFSRFRSRIPYWL